MEVPQAFPSLTKADMYVTELQLQRPQLSLCSQMVWGITVNGVKEARGYTDHIHTGKAKSLPSD